MAGQQKHTKINTITKVAGGSVARNASTGRFVEVTSDSGTSKAKPKSESVVKDAAQRRNAALQRLANR